MSIDDPTEPNKSASPSEELRIPETTASGGHTTRLCIYVLRMDDETQALFERASSGVELNDELKLIRTVLAGMTDDVNANSKRISDALVVLLRAAAQQYRQREGSSDLTALVDEIAENTLLHMERSESGATQLPLFEKDQQANEEP